MTSIVVWLLIIFTKTANNCFFLPNKSGNKVLGGWKMKCRGSSETSFDNFKFLNGECLRGKRSFKVERAGPIRYFVLVIAFFIF